MSMLPGEKRNSKTIEAGIEPLPHRMEREKTLEKECKSKACS